ncbi:hypothetical protein TNCV_1554291 [Trichonephila clavipes]|nr:hypothetical protein TNCV_1554291 [Trichonephila clavipes]
MWRIKVEVYPSKKSFVLDEIKPQCLNMELVKTEENCTNLVIPLDCIATSRTLAQESTSASIIQCVM